MVYCVPSFGAILEPVVVTPISGETVAEVVVLVLGPRSNPVAVLFVVEVDSSGVVVVAVEEEGSLVVVVAVVVAMVEGVVRRRDHRA